MENQPEDEKSGFNYFSNLCELRRLGNPGGLTENPRFGRSIPPRIIIFYFQMADHQQVDRTYLRDHEPIYTNF